MVTKVSIIVSIYNTAPYLVRCLESIDRQTLDSYEVLLINDGSTDKSEEICKSFIVDKKYYRLITKENGGLTSARLRGWKEATGEYIVFVDSDDYIEPTYCEKLYKACESNKCMLSLCAYNVINNGLPARAHKLLFRESVQTDSKRMYIKSLLAFSSESQLPAFLWLRMMKKKCITSDCFVHENKVFTEDLIFDLQYARGIEKIAIVNEPLYNYVQNEGSLTRKYRKGLWRMYKNLYEWCRHYCQEEDISDCKRHLEFLLMGGILHSIQQASRLDYASFYADYNAIYQDKVANQTLHSIRFLSPEFKALNINLKVVYILTRFMPPWLVYRFYRWRQNR